MTAALITVGAGLAICTIAAIAWSIISPDRRLWPPQRYTFWTPFIVWIPTFSIFGCMLTLGVLEWSSLPLPDTLRFGLGPLLLLIGNIGVWYEVARFGLRQTGGVEGDLKTDALYRYSRNPQYVADILIVIGWCLLSASGSTLLVAVPAIAALVLAPFAEEPWMRATYGESYRSYAQTVRRFI